MNYEHEIENEVARLQAKVSDLMAGILAVRLWALANQGKVVLPSTIDALLSRLTVPDEGDLLYTPDERGGLCWQAVRWFLYILCASRVCAGWTSRAGAGRDHGRTGIWRRPAARSGKTTSCGNSGVWRGGLNGA